jgi:hypothetical protein
MRLVVQVQIPSLSGILRLPRQHIAHWATGRTKCLRLCSVCVVDRTTLVGDCAKLVTVDSMSPGFCFVMVEGMVCAVM